MGSYEALSYCWDSENRPKIEITCNGNKLTIHQNLYDALRSIHHTNKSRFLWIDAICIDQNNTPEKNHQVQMMGKIYSNAHSVLVWIGSAQRERENPMSSHDEVSEVFSGICVIMNKWLAHNGRDDLVATYSATSKGLVTPTTERESTDPEAILGVDKDRLNQVLRFFSKQWFSRTWVIQEVVLASKAKVIWGEYEISWDWIGLVAAVIKANFCGSFFSRNSWSIPDGLMNAYLMYRLSSSQTCLPRLTFSFAELLQLTRQFQSTQEHDRIYGLLGLPTADSISEKIKPNYDSDIEFVYIDLTRLLLEGDDTLSILSSVRFTYHTVPSWVTRWGQATYSNLKPSHPHHEFKCASGVARKFRLSENKLELVVRGIIVDKVVKQAHILMSAPNQRHYDEPDYISLLRNSVVLPRHDVLDNHLSTYRRTAIQRRNALESIIKKVSGNEETLKSLAMTLTCGVDWNGYPVNSIDSHITDCISALMSGNIILGELNLLLPEPKISTQETLKVIEIEELMKKGDAVRYIDSARDTFKSHLCFVTLSGKIGRGAEFHNVLDGLLICVILGADVPFLLRPKGDGYELVGECYVYDIMHGEILDQLSDPASRGELKEEWIKLV